MKSLADRVLELVPAATGGLSLRAAIKALGQNTAHTRAAFEALDKSGRARLFRRGRGGALYLAPSNSGVLICAVETCRKEFQRGRKSKRVTCSKACQISFGWSSDPERAARRRVALSASQSTPEALARTAAHNKRRWSKPGEREKLAEQNRREWKKPEKAAIRAAKIRLKHQRPESRKFYSDMRKAEWENPVTRARNLKAQNTSKRTQAYREKLSVLAIERNKSPEFRAKVIARNKAIANDPVLKARASKRMKALWANPAWAKKTTQAIIESRRRTP